MNKIEMLKKQISLVEDLIGKTEDEAQLKKYKTEIDDLNQEIGREEAREEAKKSADEAAQKAADEAQKKELKAKQEGSSINKGIHQPKIEVGTPGMYKGFNLKAAMDKIKHNDIPMGGGFSAGAMKRMKENPAGVELVAKWGIDLLRKSLDNPVGFGNINEKAMNEGTDSAGGYLTPTEERAEVLAYIRETSIAASEATIVNMNSDVMTIPRENAKVDVAFTAEGTAATQSTPTFEQVTLTAKKMDAYTICSRELIDDTINPGGIVGLLTSQFIEAIANKHDSTVFLGTGDPMSGIFTAAIGYSEVFSSGSTAFSELLESNIRNIVSKVPVERQDNAKWYLHQTPLWQQVRGLKTTTGEYLYNDSQGGGPANARLWGFPIRSKSSNMPSTSGAGTGFIAFGDLKQAVWIGERLGFSSLFMDPYTLAVQGQVRFILFTRWAYALALPKAMGRIVTAAS